LSKNDIKFLKEIALIICTKYCGEIMMSNWDKCKECNYSKFFNRMYLKLVKERRKE